MAAFRAAQALADHGSWGAPACVAVGSIIVPTDHLPVEVRILDPQLIAEGRCGGHVAVHGRDKYLNLLACGGVALGSQ